MPWCWPKSSCTIKTLQKQKIYHILLTTFIFSYEIQIQNQQQYFSSYTSSAGNFFTSNDELKKHKHNLRE